ncbi:4-hydroxy-tetrahydrodipicolinate reductase [Sphingobium faniae]|nr:4-hydroxy-tetrahydrodipicolinate reductase [Sphingobium faniae]
MAEGNFRVGVIGPGGLGGASVREISRMEGVELAALLAFSPEKSGKDAGELVGIGPLGVAATTSLDEFMQTDASTVIYTGRDYGDFAADDTIIRLLEAGKNVITPLPYAFPKARGGDAAERLEVAAKKGGATLLGTGITPGFFNERLAMLLTGVSNDVTHIRMQEFFNTADLGESLELLQLFGFGGSLDAANQNIAVAMLAENYLIQPIHFAAEKLGLTIDRIERQNQHRTAEEEIVTPAMTIPAGTVGLVSYAWTAYVGGKPFYTTEVYWYVGETMRPDIATCDDFWTVTIEGRPSLRVSVESKASMLTGEKFGKGDPTPPGYLLTVVAMLRSVPLVERAEPGIMVPSMPELHWKPGALA